MKEEKGKENNSLEYETNNLIRSSFNEKESVKDIENIASKPSNQLTNGLGSLGFDTTGGVAWFAHIGGFITGIMLNQAFKHIRFE